ncbi:hypothetical protein [Ornithinimicrobium pratense]|uniref:LPXTG cell wall anchor domain-containing protein n=1 Tax=Ornithinimicrobium pratense TaxID=2593973 RepID=A0A5J6V7R1_9MICO|nr:hypothetical protein [Ornithinimicrobium pratense]QFG69845.1 hypothetical protein FY030_15060 [Ornithinimicrobium pratense]
MRRTTFRLALAAGTSAVLLSAGPALATTPPDDWADRFTELSGYSDVSCLVSTIPGGESSVFISEQQWSPLLQGDNEFMGVALELTNGTAEHSPFLGFGEDHIYSSSSGESIERAVVCQGVPAGEAAPADPGDDADESTEDDATDDDATDDDATDDDATDDDATDDDATDADDEDADQASGPPVETDGPSSMSGANLGLIGGAALALAGVGITGFALRRRA